MVDIAQLVSASGCGPEGRRFESDYPPHTKKSAAYFIICRFFMKIFNDFFWRQRDEKVFDVR